MVVDLLLLQPEEFDLFFQSWQTEDDVQPALQDSSLDSAISRLLSDSGYWATAAEQKAEAEEAAYYAPPGEGRGDLVFFFVFSEWPRTC